MQLKEGSQRRCSIWVAVVLAAAVVLPGDSLSVAQEGSAHVGDFIESFPADSALATIEADGHNQQFGLKELLYTIVVVEVPTEKARPIVENWDRAGASSSVTRKAKSGLLPMSAVVPASSTYSATTSEIRISDALSDEQFNELVGLGKVISSPKIVGKNGAEVNVRVGHEVSFVASYEPVKDENGNDSTTMRPKVVKIHDGIGLDLTGALDDNKENIRWELNFAHSQVKGMDPFTLESEHGPLTVQQPDLSSFGFSRTFHAPANNTLALCSGSVARELLVEQKVPLIGRVPYVGKLFRNTAEATQSISTIVLIRCRENTVRAGP